jgi:TnpA family transposase
MWSSGFVRWAKRSQIAPGACVQHPTYVALAELGKVRKTIFLCSYLHIEELRREVPEALNVTENWNSANSFILYGKGGEIATNRLENKS